MYLFLFVLKLNESGSEVRCSLCLAQLRDCELAPVVNKDLVRRVRNVNGITQHKQVLRNDIKLAAKLIHALDEKGNLWSSKSREEAQSAEVRHCYSSTYVYMGLRSFN